MHPLPDGHLRKDESAAAFLLDAGFREGYNLPLRVEGPYCGSFQCVTDVNSCPDASVVEDACGRAIACSDLCGDGATRCCRDQSGGCLSRPSDQEPFLFGDITMTFCP